MAERWLTETEQHAWRVFLRFQRIFFDRLSDDLEAGGFDQGDYEIMALLSEAPGRQLRMSELAAIVVSPRSRLTYRIDALVRRGTIERIKCDTDRRGSFAHLTDEGLEVVRKLAPIQVDSVRQYLLDVISPEDLAVVVRVMTASLNAIDPTWSAADLSPSAPSVIAPALAP